MGRDHVYGVALLSNAMHQSGYAPGMARHPRLRVLVLADDPGQEPLVVQRNRDLADELGVSYIEDVDAALRWPGVEVVSVCPQIERRGEVVRRAAASGKHLWLDKPLAPTVADCTAIVDMLQITGQKTSIVSHLGYDHIQQARRWIAQGGIGDILAIHADVHFAKGQPDRTDSPPAPAAPLGRWTYRDTGWHQRPDRVGPQRYRQARAVRDRVLRRRVYPLPVGATGRGSLRPRGITFLRGARGAGCRGLCHH